jgi:hypothetical protein
VLLDTVLYDNRIAAQLQPGHIERLGNQGIILYEEQTAVGIGCIGVRVEKKLAGAAIYRGNVDTVAFVTNVVVRCSVIEEVKPPND